MYGRAGAPGGMPVRSIHPTREEDLTVQPGSRPERTGNEPIDWSRVRASDDDRDRVVELLGEHAGAGRITLGELEERTGLAIAATTRGELAKLTEDLPEVVREPVDRPLRRTPTRWFVAIMGGSRRLGRRRMSGRLNVIAVFGGDDIDLRRAEIDGGELVINVFCLFGGPDIFVPDTVDVELSGPAIFGGNDEHGSTRAPRPGAPVIRIRSFALFGGTDVWRVPGDAQALGVREARRAARALER